MPVPQGRLASQPFLSGVNVGKGKDEPGETQRITPGVDSLCNPLCSPEASIRVIDTALLQTSTWSCPRRPSGSQVPPQHRGGPDEYAARLGGQRDRHSGGSRQGPARSLMVSEDRRVTL